LPAELDPRVRHLAARVFRGRSGTQAKAGAVVQYFVSNYPYSLDIKIPEGEDPLTYFLLRRPPAYCEYFAAGAAVLLRLGGVPTRYAAGFAPSGRNMYGGYWVARYKDAHAWCEAYDDERGWVTVEATPPAGVPAVERNSAFGAFWDSLKFRRQELAVMIQTQGLRGLGAWLLNRWGGVWALLQSWTPAGLLAKLCLAVTGAVALRRLFARPRPVAPTDPDMAKPHALLRRMDGWLSKQGRVRRADETVHQFARRIAAEKESLPEHEHVAASYTREG